MWTSGNCTENNIMNAVPLHTIPNSVIVPYILLNEQTNGYDAAGNSVIVGMVPLAGKK